MYYETMVSWSNHYMSCLTILYIDRDVLNNPIYVVSVLLTKALTAIVSPIDLSPG